jgi:hypothetical protein
VGSARMRRMALSLAVRRALQGGAVALALLGACSSNHDVLKQKPHGTGGSGTGGSAGAAPDAESDAPEDAFVEPKGTDKVTFVHGVVDAETIAFCFAKVDAGVPGDPSGAPLPPGGLAFGAAISETSLSGFDFAKDDIEPIVIAGDFSLLSGKSCSDAIALAESFAVPDAGDAGGDADASDASADDASLDATSDVADVAVELPPPPPLRALAMPVLPAGTLGAGYSTLLVAAGCIGGPAFVDDLGDLVCGAGYSTSNSTLTPLLVRMSRVTAQNHIGLQAVNASLASDTLSFQSEPGESSSLPGFAFAYSVGFGAISPLPPELGYSSNTVGPVAQAFLEVVPSGSAVPAFSSSWGTALALGGGGELQDGKSYAVVYVGPSANVPSAGKWWNTPELVALPTDP